MALRYRNDRGLCGADLAGPTTANRPPDGLFGASCERRANEATPGVLNAAPQRVLTPRTAAWLVLRRMENRNEQDRALLADLPGRAPELDETVELAEAFTGLVR